MWILPLYLHVNQKSDYDMIYDETCTISLSKNNFITASEKYCLFVLFGFYVTFNNLSVILQQCMDVAGSAALLKYHASRHKT